MPANLPPQYFEAEKAYRQAKTPEEKVEALETMLAIMPKHKGTDRLRAELRTKIAKFNDDAQKRQSTTHRGSAYNIRKEGAGQIVLIGLPNAGKSQLVSIFTDASPEIADYPFTTKRPLPGMMKFENIQIQLLDMPPITDRDSKPWFAHLLRNADLLIIMIDLSYDPIQQIEYIIDELEKMKVSVRDNHEQEEFVLGVVQKKALIVANKTDLDKSSGNLQRIISHCSGVFSIVATSFKNLTGLEEFERVVFNRLDIIRVYTKSPGRKADYNDPIVLKKGSTIADAAESVHKDFRRDLKYAQVWGSGKFDGQRVKRDYILADGDIIELHI